MATDSDMQAGILYVESADTPATPEDYLFVNGHRLASAAAIRCIRSPTSSPPDQAVPPAAGSTAVAIACLAPFPAHPVCRRPAGQALLL